MNAVHRNGLQSEILACGIRMYIGTSDPESSYCLIYTFMKSWHVRVRVRASATSYNNEKCCEQREPPAARQVLPSVYAQCAFLRMKLVALTQLRLIVQHKPLMFIE